jgi:hypothetical protein
MERTNKTIAIVAARRYLSVTFAMGWRGSGAGAVLLGHTTSRAVASGPMARERRNHCQRERPFVSASPAFTTDKVIHNIPAALLDAVMRGSKSIAKCGRRHAKADSPTAENVGEPHGTKRP